MFCSRLNEYSRQAKVSKLSLVLWLNENVRSSLSQMSRDQSCLAMPSAADIQRKLIVTEEDDSHPTTAKASITRCHETSLGDKTILR